MGEKAFIISRLNPLFFLIVKVWTNDRTQPRKAKLKFSFCTLINDFYSTFLIDGISTEVLLADRAYDVDSIITEFISQGMEVVIPPKKNRTKSREYDKALYKLRYLIENAFLYLKR